MLDQFHKLLEVAQALPGMGLLLAFTTDTKRKILIGLLVTVVPGIVWGGIGGVVQLLVFKDKIQTQQTNMRAQIDNLRHEIDQMENLNARKRREIRQEAEDAQEKIHKMRTDVKVIRQILEDRKQ